MDKGLLREVKQVQKALDSLIQCKVRMTGNDAPSVLYINIELIKRQFYDDDLRDENTVIAFRMLVKDLLILFQAGNEGVCNILGTFRHRILKLLSLR